MMSETHSSKCIYGARGICFLINPYDDIIHISYHLSFDCINNMVEYEALILGLKDTMPLKVKMIKIFGDSQLIMKQVLNIYNIKYPKLQPYKEILENLLIYFNEYKIGNIPRDNNKYFDVISSASSLAPINMKYEKTILIIKNISKSSHENIDEDHCYATAYINVYE